MTRCCYLFGKLSFRIKMENAYRREESTVTTEKLAHSTKQRTHNFAVKCQKAQNVVYRLKTSLEQSSSRRKTGTEMMFSGRVRNSVVISKSSQPAGHDVG